MSVAGTYWICFLFIGWIAAVGLYYLALRIGLMAVVDTLWTAGIGLGAMAYLLYHDLSSMHSYLVLLLVVVWSFRLSYHILVDRVFPGKEDPRYARLAMHWDGRAQRNFFFLFMAQIPLVALFLLPITTAMAVDVNGLRAIDVLAVFIALIAFAGEALADRQLATFRADASNAGGVCQTGLWRYSRHPNYFFEWLHWWAYVCFAWGASAWWLSLLGPIFMYLFLRYVTGVPPAEKSSLQSRGEAYRAYQKTTNAFFPWKPHKAQS